MRPLSRTLVAILICLVSDSGLASGFATRELNPILQSVYLPTLVPMGPEDGWRIDHSLYVTNTTQEDSRPGEYLLIDAENYRYEFALRNRRGNWLTEVTIPLVANEGGELDSVIEDWHEFFGFSNGDRDDLAQDNLEIRYRRDGKTEYLQTESSSGLGDISIALGYQQPGEIAWFAGIELPTGSEEDFSSNEKLDIAFWLTGETSFDNATTGFGMIGISFPGDGGKIEGLVAEYIWAAQLGFDYRFYDTVIATLQFDYHSAGFEDSELRGLNESLQILVGLGFDRLFDNFRLDLFFTEDIYVGSAPDITFGLRLAHEF